MSTAARCRALGRGFRRSRSSTVGVRWVLGPIFASAAAWLLGAPSVAAGQGVPGYPLRAVSPHAHGTAVAVAVRLPSGSRHDPPGREGTAWLLAAVLQDQVAHALRPHGAVFTGFADRSSTVFTLIADPEEWVRAWAVADSILFRAPLDPALSDRHRTALLERVIFEAGSPVRDFEAEALSMLAGGEALFARPPRGTRASLPTLSPSVLEAFRSGTWNRAGAALAVVGPVSPAGPDEGEEGRTEPAPPRTPPTGSGAWSGGERRVLVQDVTSAWIAIAYPVPADLPRTRLEILAHVLREELDPLPPDPERHAVGVRLEETPAGPALVVEASVFPEAAERWEGRILRAVERLGEDVIGDDFFRWKRRRFRAARLLEEVAPEVEARRLTADLLRDGRPRDLGKEIWELDPASLHDAVRRLGPPRTLVLGPDLRQNRPGGG